MADAGSISGAVTGCGPHSAHHLHSFLSLAEAAPAMVNIKTAKVILVTTGKAPHAKNGRAGG